MLRLFALIILVHVYMGWRLLPDLPFGVGGAVAVILLLVLSAGIMPFGEFARRHKHSAPKRLGGPQYPVPRLT